MPVLLLATRGRRTGQVQTTALTYLPQGKTLVVIASNGGAPHHPDWFLNLRAHPMADVQLGRHHLKVRAREADSTEREDLWTRIIRTEPRYAVYSARTTRRIPVVVLEPDRGGD